MNFADVVMGLICKKNKRFVFVYRFCFCNHWPFGFADDWYWVVYLF